MVDPARRSALSRRRFLTLSAAAAAVPVLGGCTAGPAATAASARIAAQAAGAAGRLPAAARNSIRPQVVTPLPRTPDLAVQLPAGVSDLPLPQSDGLLVLSYHNVTADGRQQGTGQRDPYTVSAGGFAAHVQLLRQSGYRSVRIADLLHARRSNVPLPPRSVLLTFDDGGAGQWVYADRVLAEAGFTAVAFLITGHLSSSEPYLTWAEAGALARTGRWDVEAHTHDLHHFVPTGAGSRRASALINRVWDPAALTLESSAAARDRFAGDLATHLRLLARAGFEGPQAFAYPFSQVQDPTNDPAFATYVRDHLAATFPLLMANGAQPRTADLDDLRSGLVPRVEVRHDMTALGLFDVVRGAQLAQGLQRIPGGGAGG
jgi:poly-beta-1,6-N-acetyl-D-glucosamine N-deacetylase